MNHRIFVFMIFILSFLIGCDEDKITNPGIIKNGTVQIGAQVWMLKNLNVNHYRNGDSIPEVRDSTQWENLTTGAWCYYNNDPAMGEIFGKLYNWYAVNDSRGLAPDGWHVPNDLEWTILVDYLGGGIVSGGKMKEIGTTHWNHPNTGATNFSNYSALPGGERYTNSIPGGEHFSNTVYSEIGSNCYWWTSVEDGDITAIHWYLKYDTPYTEDNSRLKTTGFSVRCIKD
ncbi:MAG: fibrobacter succinogenes major paralogous domain-containing protein [Candidatus Kapabacteria bacterium]|jgi:uncharacterized protein (TIGR02145 family)|nr:fibrobacter succinogenes major paralogous domain-containing protein [Candidatus Kapabacteria bacterium]